MKIKIYALTVVYQPDEEVLIKNYQNISNYIEKYIIINNHPDSKLYESLMLEKASLIKAPFNGGTSCGFNLAIRKHLDDADYFILFDQDSIADTKMLEYFINDTKAFHGKYIFAPNVYEKTGKTPIHLNYFNKHKLKDSNYFIVNKTQASGLFIKSSTFKENGLFNENYFLNLVDTEWCLRAKNNGYKIIINQFAKMTHDFGIGEARLLTYHFKYGHPYRMYYTSRDILYLAQEKKVPYIIKVKLVLKLFTSFFEVLVLDKKTIRWKFLIHGIIDYNKGIRGKGI